MTTEITVPTARPYSVVVGRDVLAESLSSALDAGVRRVAIVHPPALQSRADELSKSLVEQGFSVTLLPVPDAEAAKTPHVLAECWDILGRAGFTRTDVIAGLGGGATTDLAGFLAATWLRGVRVVQIPTTVLGMVDAAVGGKTGINTKAGKNLVGAFHEPGLVVCDLTFLDSLPSADLVPGLAEVVKCGFIADPVILNLVESAGPTSLDPSAAVLSTLIERAIRVKAAVVASDLTESAALHGGGPGREVLNYGHTLGHAIERRESYRWRHGAAVSVGMVFAAELAGLAGLLDVTVVSRHRAVLGGLGLPVSYDPNAWPDLLAAMRVDKKTRGDLLRFIVLDGLASPRVLEGPSEQLLEAAYGRIAGTR